MYLKKLLFFHFISVILPPSMDPDPEPQCTLCDLCGMEVDGKDAMRKHKATVHKPLPVPVACPQCGKIFKQKVSMQAHLQHAHLNPQDVKPWECMFCSFACKRKSLSGLNIKWQLRKPAIRLLRLISMHCKRGFLEYIWLIEMIFLCSCQKCQVKLQLC